jgi:hypothetical protein
MTDPLQRVEDAAWNYVLDRMSPIEQAGTLAAIGEQRKKKPDEQENEPCSECGNDEEDLAAEYPEDAEVDFFVCSDCRAVAGI